MKIAVVTDDGATIAQHFGRARYYQVFSIVDGSIADRELRDRNGTLHHGGHGHHEGHDHNGGHGHHEGHGSHSSGGGDSNSAGHGHHAHAADNHPGHGHHAHAADRHAGMIAQITDVDVLLAGGMGFGARQALDDAGIEVIATDLRETEAAVQAWIAGELQHKDERLH